LHYTKDFSVKSIIFVITMNTIMNDTTTKQNEPTIFDTSNPNIDTDVNISDNSEMLRKVLVIAYYFPPMGLSGVQRILKFVKYLPDFDWQPIVLTTGNTKYYAFDETLLADTNNSDLIKIYRTDKDPFANRKSSQNTTRKYPNPIKQKLQHLVSQLMFIPDSRIRWKKYALKLADEIIANEPNIKVILATAPPFTDFLIAKELSAKYGIPYVVDYRDLWNDNPQYNFPTPYHRRKHLRLERNVLRYASKAIVITRSMKEALLKRYHLMSHYDISIISHGFDADDFKNIKTKSNSDKLIITHCGLFPDDRTPKYFLRALAKFLSSNPNARKHIEARFVGIMRPAHIKMLTKYKLTDVATLTGYVPHKESIEHLMESDVLWMMLPNGLETPGRFFEYIGARKTMLICIPSGSIEQIAKDSNAAFITQPKDIDAIAQALENIYNLWKAGKLPIPTADFVAQYERKHLTKRLAKEMSFAAND
jgi:glycosyltransferase involved in cell wall biosynthesis